MEELRNYPEPPQPQPLLIDANQVSWWNGEVTGNLDRPVSVEYTPALYYPGGPHNYAWRAIVARWMEHFPLQDGPWNHFVTYLDRELGFEQQVTWKTDAGAQVYQILWQWDYAHVGVKICPHPSQVNWVSFGDRIIVWGSGRIDLGEQLTIAKDGNVWVLIPGPTIITTYNGVDYLRCKMPNGSYAGIPLTPLPGP
jgi:hypothetical protein